MWERQRHDFMARRGRYFAYSPKDQSKGILSSGQLQPEFVRDGIDLLQLAGKTDESRRRRQLNQRFQARLSR